ncbi:hypothetical protein [Microbacterium sp. SS28]|uniref:hypothetical protein n=1 Tax=Microbacterium sp. SS28 TaxID=2919948 RepID=UPI001FAA24D2|nr:hypothetical protein [Microbacterium sp. SS28]
MSPSAPPVRIVTPRGRLIGLAVFCALVAAMGVVVYAVSPTTPLNIIVGAAAVGVCGVGGGFSLVGQFRRSTLLVADDDGVRIEGRVMVPWSAIDRFGAAGSALGIRLRSYQALTDAAPKVYADDQLRATRAASGWDLTWEERLLDRPAKDAAAALRTRRP